MKRLKTIISWTIWTFVGSYVAIIILLHIPAVQRYAGQKVADITSRRLGTKVQIGRIDLGFLNRVVLDNILVYDQSNKKMLVVSRMGAKVDIIPLIQSGRINVSSAQIFGLKADLYKEDKNTQTNFQFVLDSLASKGNKTHTPLHLSINSMVIRNGAIKYNQKDMPVTPYRFNPRHIFLKDLSGHIILHELGEDIIKASLKNLSANEASGLTVRQFSFDLRANQQRLTLSNIKFISTNSKIDVSKVSAIYKSKNKKLIANSLTYTIKGLHAKIVPSEFSPLLPELKIFHTTYSAFFDAQGSYKSLHIKKLSIASATQATQLKVKGWVSNIASNPTWSITLLPAKISGNMLQNIFKAVHKPYPGILVNLGNIYYKGTISCISGKYSANGLIKTDSGDALLTASTQGNKFQATINTPGFDVAKTTGDSAFGKVKGKLMIKSTTDFSYILAKGHIYSFDYQGYSYKNIHIDGNSLHNIFSGELSLNDPNGNLRITGKAHNIMKFIQKQERLTADITLKAEDFNLKALQITDKLGNRRISFHSNLKGEGSTLDNLKGTLNLSSLSMRGEGQDVDINHLDVKINNGLLNKSLDVASDLGNLQINGQYDFATLPQSVLHIIGHYLPDLVYQRPRYDISSRQNSYSLNLQLNDTKQLGAMFNFPVKALAPININAAIREQTHAINMEVMAPGIIFYGQRLKNLSVKLNSHTQGIITSISGEREGSSGPRIVVNAKANIANNQIESSLSFQIPGRTQLHGNINSTTSFSRHHGILETALHLTPSEINVDTIALHVQPSDLTYSHNKLSINHFEISNHNQHIIANGQTSGNPEDSITIELKEIDIPYILDLVNFHSVDFSGLASGTAYIRSFFSHPQVTAALKIQDFQFENGDMGTLFAMLNYHDREGKINIDAVAGDGEGARTDIKGYVDIKNSYINLPIYAHGTQLHFLKSFCGSFMDQIELKADGWCKVVGQLKDVNLEGDMRASGNIYIKPTGSTYTLKDCHIRMIPNEIIFVKDTITDPHGHVGIVTGGLHHNELRHLTYDINIEAQNLLVYNFPKHEGKESFWGMVYGTGNCKVKGGPGETTMDIELAPEQNTFITYNAASAGDIGSNSFIRWAKPSTDSIEVELPTTSGTTHHPARDGKSKIAVIPGYTDIPSDLHMNFLLRTNPNLTLGVLLDEATGDNIILNGSGMIRATYYNKGNFQLFGNYNVERGQYNLTIQNIIKKQFAFQNGSTIAFGGDPFRAALSLKGLYTLNSVPLSDLGMGNSFTSNNTKVNCLLNIDGTPAAPTVTFGLDLPALSSDARQMIQSVLNSEQEMNQQVLYLLAVGRFYPQSNNNSTTQREIAQSQTSLAMQSLLSGTLSQQINTVLSNMVKNNNWNFGANIATGNEGFDNAEYEGILSGSMFNNRLLFNGEFGYRDNVAKNSSSFIGDFDVRYLLFPSGNVALRFYNQTNDRYFTRNSLTTQGIGIILKKDFNTLGDLFSTKRKKAKKDRQKH